MHHPPIDRLADLQQFIADLAKVQRAPHLADNNRQENDVEHSFGLALTCWYLQPKIASELDLLKILQYALAHDAVEVHAGDTFAHDKAAMALKDDRERAAIDTLRSDWSDFPELADFAEGYMDRIDEEAKFVKAVDKILPVIMTELGLKNDSFWARTGIDLAEIRANKVSIRVSDYVRPYYEKLIVWLEERGNISI